VLAEQGVSALDNIDVSKLTEDTGNRGLDSPSKMVAINLANGNPIFREKLRLKLEQSGGLHYDLDTGGVFVKRGKGSESKRGSGRGSGNTGGEDDGGGMGADAESTPGQGSSERKKGKAKRVRHVADNEDSNDGEGSEEGRAGGGAESSLMKRRRKAELSIGVPAALPGQSDTGVMGPPEDTPGTKLMKYRSGMPLSSSNLHGMNLESPFSLEKHVGFESGYPISADTPTLAKLMNLIPPMSKSIGSDLKFDFDEVVQHFHSPRTQLEVAARWGGGSGQATNLDSTTSIGSIDSVFNFSIDGGGGGPLSKASLEAVDSMFKQQPHESNSNQFSARSHTPSHSLAEAADHGSSGGLFSSGGFSTTPGNNSKSALSARSSDGGFKNIGSGSQPPGSAQKLLVGLLAVFVFVFVFSFR
jgi:hypothetical protein